MYKVILARADHVNGISNHKCVSCTQELDNIYLTTNIYLSYTNTIQNNIGILFL